MGIKGKIIEPTVEKSWRDQPCLLGPLFVLQKFGFKRGLFSLSYILEVSYDIMKRLNLTVNKIKFINCLRQYLDNS
jgi:hypothetical protein